MRTRGRRNRDGLGWGLDGGREATPEKHGGVLDETVEDLRDQKGCRKIEQKERA